MEPAWLSPRRFHLVQGVPSNLERNSDFVYIGKADLNGDVFFAVSPLRAVYHDLTYQLADKGRVQLLDFHVLVHQLQEPAHVGNLPDLALGLLFQPRPTAGLVLGQYLLGEVLPEHLYIGQNALNADKLLFSDQMDFAGAGVAL